jgi:glutaredoxin
MKNELVLYTRKDCCLCEDMKEVIARSALRFPFSLQEFDVDSSGELQERFGPEVPVLFVNGRKAFKYRVSPKELEKKLKREPGDR